ncbi:kinetochore protein Nuf2 [Diachasma alloeum]|uniref:kinetochore protein Nuf2 n=1 Tax=Diachasma alloeum TaxID=454923 RepID=UPI00073818A6|nr:kinetochore protein Nuf2 [Diachasma alloeum]XP_015115023.1 kinetochore protein Nuf2 [Diachasma alloeum]
MDNADTLEAMQTLLEQVALPSSLEQIKSPTEDFMVNLISAFFTHCHINVAAIKQLTPNQLNALEVTNPENAWVAPILNLREAMATVGRKIFLKDFQITDITSPRHIRAKRQLRLMGNFLLYANNKKSHMQGRIDGVLSRAERIQSVRTQKQEIMERMNKQAMTTAQKKVELERIREDVNDNEVRISQNKSKIASDDKVLKEREELRAQKIARNQAKRANLQKRQDTLDELSARIVKSPEKFRAQLRELTEARKNQEEKRENMLVAILHKKTLLQNFEAALGLIKKEQSKLKEVIEDQKKLKAMKKENERLREEVEEAQRTISLAENLGNQEEHQVIAGAIQECEKQCQERILKVKKSFMEIDAEKKSLERKRENLEIRCTELGSETLKIRRIVGEVERDIETFFKECQELHDSEVAKVQRLHSAANPGME